MLRKFSTRTCCLQCGMLVARRSWGPCGDITLIIQMAWYVPITPVIQTWQMYIGLLSLCWGIYGWPFKWNLLVWFLAGYGNPIFIRLIISIQIIHLSGKLAQAILSVISMLKCWFWRCISCGPSIFCYFALFDPTHQGPRPNPSGNSGT